MRTTTLIVLTVALSLLNIGCDSTSSRDAVFYNNRGLDYYNQGELDKAIGEFTKSIGLDPQLAVAYANRGFMFEELGNKVNAEVDYAKAKELGMDLE